MKKIFFLLPLICLAACAGGSGGELTVLDVEKAIADRRPFDLTEIAGDIEFIPLDDSRTEALIGNVTSISGSQNAYQVLSYSGGATSPVAVFDPSGRFVGTRGTMGRSTDEYMAMTHIAADPDTDNFYASGTMGDMSTKMTGYNAQGTVFASIQSPSPGSMVFHKGRLFGMHGSPASPFQSADHSTVGTTIPLLEIYDTGLTRQATITTIDKGLASTLFIDGNPADPSTIRGMSILSVRGLMATDGEDLLIKEALSDTLMRLGPGDVLEPVALVNMGRHKVPQEAFGVNPVVSTTDRYVLNGLMVAPRWWMVATQSYEMGGASQRLIFDRRTGEGFTPLGPDGNPGLFLDGLAFTPAYVHDGRLTGHLSALAIVDAAAAGSLTHPGLKTLAATLREESNPVIVRIALR